jgi:hypothetical protein
MAAEKETGNLAWALAEIAERIASVGEFGSVSFDVIVEHGAVVKVFKRSEVESLRPPENGRKIEKVLTRTEKGK